MAQIALHTITVYRQIRIEKIAFLVCSSQSNEFKFIATVPCDIMNDRLIELEIIFYYVLAREFENQTPIND